MQQEFQDIEKTSYSKYITYMTTLHPHLLIVDDEEMLLKLTRRGLERLGYRITTFSNSGEALRSFSEEPHRFDLIITDKTMPHLSGLELLQKVREIRADIPTILFTGFIDDEQERDIKNKVDAIKVLLKPMRLRALEQEIKSMLTHEKISAS